MCQLLGMNAAQPVSLPAPLQEFMQRGGGSDHHADGWGLAHYAGQQCRVQVDTAPAAHSRLAHQLCAGHEPSRTLIAHVRKATQGAVTAANCHPFVRPLWGRDWAFAHNGHLQGPLPPCDAAAYLPVGSTDSEHAFCCLLNGLHRRFGRQRPPLQPLHAALQEDARRLASHGSFNFLLSDGERLFAFRSTELYRLHSPLPRHSAPAPDCQHCADDSCPLHPRDSLTLIATRPLADGGNWQPLPEGEVVVFNRGCREI